MPVEGESGLACRDRGTFSEGFLPRGWDHPVASDGTIRRVVPGVLITFLFGCLQVVDGQVHHDTHAIPIGNYVIAVGNYVIVSLSELGNYKIADTGPCAAWSPPA